MSIRVFAVSDCSSEASSLVAFLINLVITFGFFSSGELSPDSTSSMGSCEGWALRVDLWIDGRAKELVSMVGRFGVFLEFCGVLMTGRTTFPSFGLFGSSIASKNELLFN